jgi:hypothetical protein
MARLRPKEAGAEETKASSAETGKIPEQLSFGMVFKAGGGLLEGVWKGGRKARKSRQWQAEAGQNAQGSAKR